jgi:hypothetical protein
MPTIQISQSESTTNWIPMSVNEMYVGDLILIKLEKATRFYKCSVLVYVVLI